MKSKEYIRWLDWIRFLAAFAVLICHGRNLFLPEYSMLSPSQQNPITLVFYLLTRLGNEAVIIFFVLSGYLVGGRNLDRLLNDDFDVRSYFIDRFSRIFPPLLGCILFYSTIMFFGGNLPTTLTILGNLLSLQGILVQPMFATLWTLAYEVWFYILFGLMGAFCISKNGRVVLFILICISVLALNKLGLLYLFIWVCGIIAYFIKKKLNHYLIGLLVIISMMLTQISSQGKVVMINIPIPSSFSTTMLAMSFATFLSQSPKTTMNKVSIMDKVGTLLSSFTYTLYLSHVPCYRMLNLLGIQRADDLTIDSIMIYTMAFSIAIFISVIMYWLFERNSFLLKKILKNI